MKEEQFCFFVCLFWFDFSSGFTQSQTLTQGNNYIYFIWEVIPKKHKKALGKLREKNGKANEVSMSEWVTSVESWGSFPLEIFWETM